MSNPIKFDDTSWHEIEGRPLERAVHIGFYAKWLALTGLLVKNLAAEAEGAKEKLRQGSLSADGFLQEVMDGVIVNDQLTEEGLAFTSAYYEKHYGRDLSATFPEQTDSFLKVADTQANYTKLASLLSRRFQEWRQGELLDPPKARFATGIKNLFPGRKRG